MEEAKTVQGPSGWYASYVESVRMGPRQTFMVRRSLSKGTRNTLELPSRERVNWHITVLVTA